MRAVAVFPSEQVLKVVDHPEPRVEADDEVLLQILDVGICGTDREISRFEYGSPPAGVPYLVLGHESLARVLEAGGGGVPGEAGGSRGHHGATPL